MFRLILSVLLARLRIVAFAVFGALALLITFTSRAHAQELSDPTNLAGFLNFVAVGGSLWVTVRLLSWVSANVTQFEQLQPSAKQIIHYVLSGALGLGAVWVLNNVPATALAQAQPYFAAFIFSIGGIQVNQEWHANVNKGLAKKGPAHVSPPEASARR